jgi:hypothetical protein
VLSGRVGAGAGTIAYQVSGTGTVLARVRYPARPRNPNPHAGRGLLRCVCTRTRACACARVCACARTHACVVQDMLDVIAALGGNASDAELDLGETTDRVALPRCAGTHPCGRLHTRTSSSTAHRRSEPQARSFRRTRTHARTGQVHRSRGQPGGRYAPAVPGAQCSAVSSAGPTPR